MATIPAGVTKANFDEAYYLLNAPDVALRVPGTFASGWDHFSQGGYAEGRPWRTIGVTVPADILTTNAADAAFVNQLYRGYFGRAPDDGGWRFWVNEIVAGRKTRAGVEDAFKNDHEAIEYARTRQPGPPPVIGAPSPPAPQPGAGILDGSIFGVPTKFILIGAAAYFLLGKK